MDDIPSDASCGRTFQSLLPLGGRRVRCGPQPRGEPPASEKANRKSQHAQQPNCYDKRQESLRFRCGERPSPASAGVRDQQERQRFRSDATTQKPSGSIEYEIDKAGSNEKVMGFSEDAGGIANASASQVSIEKMMPLRPLGPGAYTLKVTVTDKNGNQTVQQQANFAVSLE
jgi:hypothetical protein